MASWMTLTLMICCQTFASVGDCKFPKRYGRALRSISQFSETTRRCKLMNSDRN